MRTTARPGWSSQFMSKGLYIITAVYVTAAILASFAAPVPEFDESIPLVHGMLVQQGHTPNVDFASFYPPLGLYLNAAVFNLFGRTVMATRAIAAVLYLLVILLTYWFFRLRFPHSRPIIPAAVLVVAASIGLTLNMAVWPGFSTALIALLTYLCYQSDGGNRRWIMALSGFLTGVAVLYRVNFGAYVAAVVFGDLLLQWWLDRGKRWSGGLKEVLWNMLIYAVPLAVFITGFCFWAYGKNISTAVYEFTINTQKIMVLRGFYDLESYADLTVVILLPLGWFSFRILQGKDNPSARALIPIALAFILFGLTLAGRTKPSIAIIIVALELFLVVLMHVTVYRLERSELCILLFFCCLMHYYLTRGDWYHWRILPIIQAMLLVFLLFSRFGGDEEGDGGWWVSTGTSLAVLMAAFCLLLQAKDFRISASYLRNGVRLISRNALPPYLSDTDRMLGATPPGPGWASVYTDADELQTLRYVRSITRSTDPIFVGVKDHSRVFNNDLRFYWLAGRPIGTKIFQLEPKVATEEPVQRAIISDFEKNGVKCVIVNHEPFLGDETYLKTGYVGSTVLDEYIGKHFQEQARFGRLAVLTRID